MSGQVFLVGAGPGDPGLITVRGAELIATADVVLYDGLANPDLLLLARDNCELVCVGKHGHSGYWKQAEIDAELARHAELGKRVVRLKGGDTGVFARTSEEVDSLVRADIPFEIVPGITAALAVAAYTGIPITHRDWSSAVALVAGQNQFSDSGLEPDDQIDWRSLASFPGTLILYMGLSNASVWSSKLMEAGKSPATPVALVRRCTWPDQRVIQCTLGTLLDSIRGNAGFRSPAIAIVGDVVRVAKTNNWFESRPLFGKKIVIASPLPSALRMSKVWRSSGAEIQIQPSMVFESIQDWQQVDAAIKTISEFDWLIFSSAYGVDQFFNRLRYLDLDARSLCGCKLAAVGGATAEAIEKYSLICDLYPKRNSGGTSLADELVRICPSKNCLLIRNPSGDINLSERLIAAGSAVTTLDVYLQCEVSSWPASTMDLFRRREIDAVVVTSRNIAGNAVKLLGELAPLQRWLSLSPSITQSLKELGCDNVVTASEATFAELVQALIDSLNAGA